MDTSEGPGEPLPKSVALFYQLFGACGAKKITGSTAWHLPIRYSVLDTPPHLGKVSSVKTSIDKHFLAVKSADPPPLPDLNHPVEV